MEEDIGRKCEVIVWLNFYDCLNKMFNQHILALWSPLQRLSTNLQKSKLLSKCMLTFT